MWIFSVGVRTEREGTNSWSMSGSGFFLHDFQSIIKYKEDSRHVRSVKTHRALCSLDALLVITLKFLMFEQEAPICIMH